eukprot:CCRYP_005525-RA/>CCRYP_005525-RA protein AED:0.00 eAED:0.00 QI:81/1/1/1/0/0/2/71/35
MLCSHFLAQSLLVVPYFENMNRPKTYSPNEIIDQA